MTTILSANGLIEIPDTLIAATARLHGLTVPTRNVNDFRRCGVPVVNPFE